MNHHHHHRYNAFIDESNISTINSLALEDIELYNNNKSSKNGSQRRLCGPLGQLRSLPQDEIIITYQAPVTEILTITQAHTPSIHQRSKSCSTSWYVLPSNIVIKRPTFCSMEMISFDKENECFHRTEIAYPYHVLEEEEPTLTTKSQSTRTKSNQTTTRISYHRYYHYHPYQEMKMTKIKIIGRR